MDIHVAKKKTNMEFFRLPDEVLYFIFRFLDIKSLGSVSKVCRRFNSLMQIDCLWTNVSNKMTIIQIKDNRCLCFKRNAKKQTQERSKPELCCLKEKCRLATRWSKEIGYWDKTLIQYRKKQRPCLQMDNGYLWVSSEQNIDCYKMAGEAKVRRFVKMSKTYQQSQYTNPSDNYQNDVSKFQVNGDIIISGHRNGDVCRWTKDENKDCIVCHAHNKDINCVDTIDNVIATASDDELVKIILMNDESLTEKAVIPVHDRVWSVALSFDKTSLLSGSAGNDIGDDFVPDPIVLWNLERCSTMASFHTSEFNSGIFVTKFDTESTFFTTGYDGVTRLWDLRTQSLVQEWTEPYGYAIYSLDTDGYNALFTGTARHGNVRFWDRRNTKSHVQMYFADRRDSPVYCLDFDHSHLYVGLDHGVHMLDFS